mgnify:CR=1 FL=1
MQEISRVERYADASGWVGRNVARTALIMYATSLIPTTDSFNYILQNVGIGGLFFFYPLLKTAELKITRRHNKLLSEKPELLTVLDPPQFLEYNLPYIELVPGLEKMLINRFEGLKNFKDRIANISEINSR